MKKYVVGLVLLFATAGNAKVTEISKIVEILPEVTADTLVVFDLDNTIMEPTQTLGTDQWYGHLVKQGERSGLSRDEAIDRAIETWLEVQEQTKMRPVESITPEFVASLNQQGVPTLGLTARPTDLMEATLRQLGLIKVFLNSFVPGVLVDLEGVSQSESILFVGPKNNKGTVLLKALRSFPNIRKVLFVDDKLKHVKNVEAALGDSVLFEGFRYGAADATVRKFSPIVACIQLSIFRTTGVIVSDTEAYRRRHAHSSEAKDCQGQEI